ncbi:MAG: hypothetical protein QOF77_227 [Solirubrobacteraceae bacterium]|jgi:hypothetical protein|nr:hypothetical protein [Solirubrobacteraceae bacterium]
MSKDHHQLANDLERQADELEDKGDRLDRGIREARDDWERKRADPAVPGAAPPDDDALPAPDGAPSPRDPSNSGEDSAAGA